MTGLATPLPIDLAALNLPRPGAATHKHNRGRLAPACGSGPDW
jgi:hypothetical protein